MSSDGTARYSYDERINLHVFEINFCISGELMQKIKLFRPHRDVLQRWDTASLFAQLSTITALVKAACDYRKKMGACSGHPVADNR